MIHLGKKLSTHAFRYSPLNERTESQYNPQLCFMLIPLSSTSLKEKTSSQIISILIALYV